MNVGPFWFFNAKRFKQLPFNPLTSVLTRNATLTVCLVTELLRYVISLIGYNSYFMHIPIDSIGYKLLSACMLRITTSVFCTINRSDLESNPEFPSCRSSWYVI